MLYVNDHLVTEERELEAVAQQLQGYLFKEKLILVNSNQEPFLQEELADLLMSKKEELKLTAIHSSIMLREFKLELEDYIQKVEAYVEDMRESADFSGVLNGFIQVMESLLEFSAVEKFLQKDLIDQQQLNELSTKVLARAEEGNFEYVLDVLEYEVLAILHHFLAETNEVM